MDKKKPFGQTAVGKILTGLIPSLASVAADVLPGGNIIKALIQGDNDTSEEQKNYAIALLEADAKDQEQVTRRWESDNKHGVKLSKYVRPISLIAVDAFYLIGWSAGLDVAPIQGLVMLVNGGYFGARSIEKIMGTK